MRVHHSLALLVLHTLNPDIREGVCVTEAAHASHLENQYAHVRVAVWLYSNAIPPERVIIVGALTDSRVAKYTHTHVLGNLPNN